MWRPEVDFVVISHLFSTVIFWFSQDSWPMNFTDSPFQPLQSPAPELQMHCLPYPAAYGGSGDPNSGPHVCQVLSFQTEPFPQPLACDFALAFPPESGFVLISFCSPIPSSDRVFHKTSPDFPSCHICANHIQIFTVFLRIKDFKQWRLHAVIKTLAMCKDKESSQDGEISCHIAHRLKVAVGTRGVWKWPITRAATSGVRCIFASD